MEPGQGKGKGRDECVYVCGGCERIKRFCECAINCVYEFFFFFAFGFQFCCLFFPCFGTDFTVRAFGFALQVNFNSSCRLANYEISGGGHDADLLRPHILMVLVKKRARFIFFSF